MRDVGDHISGYVSDIYLFVNKEKFASVGFMEKEIDRESSQHQKQSLDDGLVSTSLY